MKRIVACTCQYCGETFIADSRHPHARCCGRIVYRRKANAKSLDCHAFTTSPDDFIWSENGDSTRAPTPP